MQFKSPTSALNRVRVFILRLLHLLFGRSHLVQDGAVNFVRDSRMSLDMSFDGFESDTQLLASLLSDRDRGIGLDVGANPGLWSLALVNCSSQIYAFEPDPEVRALLEINLSYNPDLAQKIEVSRFAISDRSEVSRLYVRRSLDNLGRVNNGLSSLVRDSTFVKHSVPVTTISLDEFTHLRSLRISWIKIDVEGLELKVLQGAQETLLNFPYVVWEMLFDHASDKEQQLSTVMRAFPSGYSHFGPAGLSLKKVERSLISSITDTKIFSLPNSLSNLWSSYAVS